MERIEPNPIKNYYIAYFDILGYKDFFRINPEKVHDFLYMIHSGIQETLNKISVANQSLLAASVASMHIEVRVFSDNILLCLEEMDTGLERIRLLSFIMMVAEIQRGFITQCKLFVRGGITKGPLSINADYVFGKGLIDAVMMESSTEYPRIEIAPNLVNTLCSVSSYTEEEREQAIAINKCFSKGEEVSDEDHKLYNKVATAIQREYIFSNIASALVFPWPDGKYILSYLYCFDINSLIPTEDIQMMLDMVKSQFPADVNYLNIKPADLDRILKRHRDIVKEQLKKYGQNNDIEVGNTTAADLREHILKKYIWVMAYHNLVCEFYRRPDYKILTRCNCDTRFLKIKIEVLEDEAELKADKNQLDS